MERTATVRCSLWPVVPCGIVLASLVLPLTCLGLDDNDEFKILKAEIETIQRGQKETQKALRGIKDILLGKQPPLDDDVVVTVAGSPVLGNRDTRVAIVEFTDFECPFCANYARGTYGQIVTEYVETGKVRYISRNFPLEPPHTDAGRAAEAALCAKDQGRYWEARDRFLGNQRALAVAGMPDHAAALGLDLPSFRQCFESRKYKAAVDRDFAEGRDLGVRGTPTFFIGYTDPNDPSRIRAVKLLVGSVAFRDFQRAIEEVLVEVKQGKRAEP